MKKILLWGVGGVAVLFVVAQVIPYGRNHTNPPVTKEVAWDTPRTAELAKGACYDCHSNLTDWKWYTNVAPFSWLVYNDVQGGRENVNFTEWDKPQVDASEIVEAAQGGGMPPVQYKLMHSGARLSSSERDELVAGLKNTLAQDPPIPGGGGG